MSESPIQRFLSTVDRLDLDSLWPLFAANARVMTVFGECAAGHEQVVNALSGFFGELRATQHEVTAEWNPEPDTWIAETTATYDLKDFSRRGPYQRASLRARG